MILVSSGPMVRTVRWPMLNPMHTFNPRLVRSAQDANGGVMIIFDPQTANCPVCLLLQRQGPSAQCSSSSSSSNCVALYTMLQLRCYGAWNAFCYGSMDGCGFHHMVGMVSVSPCARCVSLTCVIRK